MSRVRIRLLRITCLACALLWAGIIYYLSDQPSIEIAPLFRHQDKFMHLAAYFVLGLFAMGAMRAGGTGYGAGRLWRVIVLTGLYGLLDEYHQSFVPGRNASIADGLADITGAVLGAGLMFLLARRYARRDTGRGIHSTRS